MVNDVHELDAVPFLQPFMIVFDMMSAWLMKLSCTLSIMMSLLVLSLPVALITRMLRMMLSLMLCDSPGLMFSMCTKMLSMMRLMTLRSSEFTVSTSMSLFCCNLMVVLLLMVLMFL